jgi:Na+-transporting methylmalonyl-CoA/oxaloacetate decarboxylase beta subunit
VVPVSRLEKICFPFVIAIIVNLLLPPVAPLITMLMLGNMLREVFKIMNWMGGGKINPLIGSAGIASVPIAARVSHVVGL